ncbi:MAG: AsmA family protein [Pseudomonadota bacterium]
MKWLVRILFILIAVFGLSIGALLLLPGDKLGELLSEQVKAQTGRDLVFAGNVNFTFWPVLGIETGPVTFGNASWAGPEPMLSADSLAFGVDAAGLLAGDLRIKRVFADSPVLRLEMADGRGNWVLEAPASTTSTASGESVAPVEDSRPVVLEQLELSNARLIYVENGVTKWNFNDVNLSASWPEISAPMVMEANMAVTGGTVQVDLKIPDLPTFASGAVAPLTLSLTAPGGEIVFDGRVNTAGEMDGNTQIKTQNTEKLLAAFGQDGVTVPNGLGRVADVSGKMTYTNDGRISLRSMTAVLDHNQFAGEADIEIADPPKITARLTAGNLDLSTFADATGSSDGTGGTGAAATAQGWSTTPIDASALSLANGSIRLTAESIAVPDLTLGKSDLTLTLDRSRAVLKMNPATLFSGLLTGQVVANNRNGLSIGGNFKAQDINVQQALSTLGGINRFSGTGSGSLEFLGIGQTEDAIMKSLSGKGDIAVGKGIISGFDLDKLMGRGNASGGTTVFNSLTASFTIDGGNLTNNDLLMTLDNFRADGTGRVGIGARDIDYLFTPVALRANSGHGISVPVRIVGPWSNPAIKPDLTKVIEAAAEGQLKDLEDDAKQKVFEKVGEELDTTVTDSGQIGDALKDKLEDEAKKGLLKLFGGD